MKQPIRLSNRDTLIAIFKDPDRKPILRIIFECFILFFTYRELPKHYFSRYLFKKEKTNIKDHPSNNFLSNISYHFNDKRIKEVLDNKLYFDLFYSQFNISLPKILMFNHKRIFFSDHKIIEVKSIEDFVILVEKLFKQNPSCDSIFIKKTYASSGGKNIFKLHPDQLRTDIEIINQIYSEVTCSEFIFQQTLIQHPDLNKLNSSCINTIRIDTFINNDGIIDIISALIRMSINNSYIDNISSGGCMVGIDLQTGKMKKYGYSLINITGVKILTEHPVTKTVFENFNIPFFPQVKEFVLKTASLTPGMRLVGWDVAIGETGPVMIEGNSDYDIRGNDITNEGYLSNPVFRKVLAEIKML